MFVAKTMPTTGPFRDNNPCFTLLTALSSSRPVSLDWIKVITHSAMALIEAVSLDGTS